MTTKRKPYIRDMPSNWWQKLGFYRCYMLREGTAKATVVIYNNAKAGPLPFIVTLWIVTAVVTVAILTTALRLI